MAGNQDDIVIGVSLDTKTIKTGVNRVVGDIDYITQSVSRSFDALGKKIDKAIPSSVQTRIQNMVGIGTKSTKEWTGALAQQGAELEKLRTKYNPIFAAVKQYQASVVDIQQAHRVGALSADEMAAAIQRERKATLDSIAAIKQRNSAVSSMKSPISTGPNRFNTANIAAQFQDIAVTSAMGMSPVQIALQQGTQLSAVFNEMGKGRDVIKGIGAAFASIVNPVSLVTVGVIAAGAALAQYIASAGGLKSVDEVLEENRKRIDEITAGYKEAKAAYDAYTAAKSIKTNEDAEASSEAQIKSLTERYKEAQAEIARYNNTLQGYANASLSAQIIGQSKALGELAKSAGEANADMNAISSSLVKMMARGFATTELKSWAEQIKKSVDGALDLRNEIGAVEAAADKLTPATEAFSRLEAAINSITTEKSREEVQALYEKFRDGKLSVNELRKALGDLSANAPDLQSHIEEILRLSKAAANAKAEIDNIWKGSPGREGRNMGPGLDQKSFNDRFGGNQDAIDALERQRKELEKKPKRTAEDRRAERDANAYRDLVKSAQDRIQQLQLEEQLVGKTGVAAETLRMRLELLQRAQDKGRSISEAQRAEIEKLSASYGESAEKVAALSLAEELRFEREQMFRSPTEQRVYGQLRSAGIDPESARGQALASQIRLNEALAEGRDLAADFAQGLADDLSNGASAMDALRNAASRLGAKLIEMGTNQVINNLFSNLAGGLGSGSFTPNTTLGNFLKGIPGFAAGTNYAPGGMALVGERGPELVNLPRGAQVIPNDILGSIARGGISAPRVPSIPSAANNNSSSFTFAPVIDARGADVAAVARLEQIVAKQQAEFSGRVVQTMRQAKSTRNWRG
ncbi:phage tail length tape measure family protein [Brucella sp. 2280]|uniref:phage tail length tape measure family protein n=1 Tax=Brucella sp. 2280 TaxID=2592625 RepID=UPI001294C90E|nr:phage tail length tape measure family protein [Brucella sp. 2280]QGA55851.1 hypothetical protein GHC20_01610 [Brucella sp. 2280]